MKKILFIYMLPVLFSVMLFANEEKGYVIETNRCLLRPIQVCDAETLYTLSCNHEVIRYTKIFNTKKSVDEIKQYIVSTTNPLQWAIIEKETNQIIGFTFLYGFDLINKKAEVAQFLFPQIWSQGFGTEVRKSIIKFGFETLGLVRLQATCDPRNTINNKLLVKCGFKLEGYLRNYYFMNGMLVDRNMYSITQEDYNQNLDLFAQ